MTPISCPASAGASAPRKTNAKPAVSATRKGEAGRNRPPGEIRKRQPSTGNQENCPRQRKSRGRRFRPGGLSCAAELAQLGYEVHIFEALHAAGGVLTHGFRFRLPQRVVDAKFGDCWSSALKSTTTLSSAGRKRCGSFFNEGFRRLHWQRCRVSEIHEDSGENLNGVLSANEFLTRINLMKAHLPSTTRR